MKKKINGKKNNFEKKAVIFVVITIFLLVISSSLVLIDRKYFFIESYFKEINSKVNKYFIDHLYTNKDFKNNMINSKTKYLEYENDVLRKSLKVNESNNNYVIAEVINHTSKYFFDRIDISKGLNDGIKKGSAVVNDKGLIGFISKVGKNVSEVKLLTSVNENNIISVIIENNDKKIPGVLKKYDPINNVFEVTDIIGKTDSLNNSKVSLSNYNNTLYNNIYIGIVKEEKTSNYGLSKTLLVKQDIDYSDLLFVWVVK